MCHSEALQYYNAVQPKVDDYHIKDKLLRAEQAAFGRSSQELIVAKGELQTLERERVRLGESNDQGIANSGKLEAQITSLRTEVRGKDLEIFD